MLCGLKLLALSLKQALVDRTSSLCDLLTPSPGLFFLRQHRLSRVPHPLNHATFIIHLSGLVIRAHAMYLAAQPRRGGGVG